MRSTPILQLPPILLRILPLLLFALVAATSFAQSPQPTVMTVYTKAGPKGADMELVATLKTDGGGGVFNRLVQFTVDGVPVGSDNTSLDGWCDVSYTIPSTFVTGSVHEIGAQFVGDSSYAASSGTSTLTIWKADTAVTVSAVQGPAGKQVLLEASLTANGVGLPGKVIRFRVNGDYAGDTTTETTAPGRATVLYTIPAGQGTGSTLDVTAYFFSDDDFYSSNGTNTLTVGKYPSILVLPAKINTHPNGVVQLSTTLEANDYVRAPGRSVRFTIDGVDFATVVTNSQGVATKQFLVPAGFTLGSHHLVGAYFDSNSDPDFLPTSNTSSLDVKRPLAFYVGSSTGLPGETTNLIGIVLDKLTNSRLPGLELTFTVDGTVVGTAVSGGDGYAILPFSIPAGWSPKTTHVVDVAFADPDHDTYEPWHRTGTLTTIGRTRVIAPTVIDAAGTTTKLSGVLLSLPSGSRLGGKTLTFTVDGSSVGSGVTAPNGTVTIPFDIPAGWTFGSVHTLVVSFDGGSDASYGSSTVSTTLTLAKTSTKIVVPSTTAAVGGQVTLSGALLAKSSGLRIAGRTLKFMVDGVDAGSAVTAANGFAKVTFNVPDGWGDGSSHTVTVSFDDAGDAEYGTSSSGGVLSAHF